MPEVVHVGGDEAAVVELPQVVARLVVPADEQRRHGRLCLAAVVPMEGAELLVLVRHAHALEVVDVADRLEVAAAYQEVNLDVFDPFQVRQGGVDLVQLAVAAALHRDPHLPRDLTM